ncbi:MAG: polyprenyl synthetase family protein [Paludibacteraceae bacterium]|nr:polyprenyl synthetase family protein [Paludibacteraceae bacterium]
MIDINRQIEQINWHREPYGLYEPIEYTLRSGGKRLRPQLALLGSQLFGGKDEEVLPAALALEVFHNFTLLHDDVMDKAMIRRGRPTVHVRWNENTAILSGDQMMIEAYRLLSRLPDDKLPHVLRLFNEMATGICEGQQYDMEFETREDVTIDEYMRMIRLKTAVLPAYALRIGAYLAGANEVQQQTLYDYGISVGLAFQIQDDLLDVYGDPATFGKAIGGDILCGKKTFMLLTAYEKADADTRTAMMAALNNQDMPPEDKIVAVTCIYNRLCVRNDAEKVIGTFTEKALQCLNHLPDNDAATHLKNLANSLANRTL